MIVMMMMMMISSISGAVDCRGLSLSLVELVSV